MGFCIVIPNAPTAEISNAARVKLILNRLFVARGYASVHIRFPNKYPYEDLCRRIRGTI
jgi:hypothetical protein